MMELNRILEDTKLTVCLKGKLDSESAPELNAELASSLVGITELVIDMTELSYVSSAGLRVLLTARKQMNPRGKMVIRGARENIRDVLRFTGFTELMNVE